MDNDSETRMPTPGLKQERDDDGNYEAPEGVTSKNVQGVRIWFGTHRNKTLVKIPGYIVSLLHFDVTKGDNALKREVALKAKDYLESRGEWDTRYEGTESLTPAITQPKIEEPIVTDLNRPEKTPEDIAKEFGENRKANGTFTRISSYEGTIIKALIGRGLGQSSIAQLLQRPQSTISLWLKRNS